MVIKCPNRVEGMEIRDWSWDLTNMQHATCLAHLDNCMNSYKNLTFFLTTILSHLHLFSCRSFMYYLSLSTIDTSINTPFTNQGRCTNTFLTLSSNLKELSGKRASPSISPLDLCMGTNINPLSIVMSSMALSCPISTSAPF